MKLPENMSKIVGKTYTGQKDDEGRPHGYEKDMPDNAVGTMRYGRHAEIRGAVIIALEDNKYDTHSFHFQKDLDNVLVAISDLTGGLYTAFRESE